MAKIKCKSVIAAASAAALLASGTSASGLRGAGNEVVVASVRISSKQGLNDDPPPNNLEVIEKVIAETAPFQMISQKRSLEDEKDRAVVDEKAGGLVSDAAAKKAKKEKEAKEKFEKEKKE